MTLFNAGTLEGQARDLHRTVHGPVVGYATVDGRRVAISRKRSSYLLDGVDLLLSSGSARQDPQRAGLHQGRRRSRRRRSTRSTPTRRIGHDHHRAAADPGQGRRLRACPTDGAALRVEGLSVQQDHPHGIVRRRRAEQLEQQAGARVPGAPTTNGRTGSMQRVRPAQPNTNKHGKNTLATLTGAMNAAATQDVRAIEFVPVLAEVLQGGAAPSARSQRMLELLEAGAPKGGSRLDRDLDGRIDDPGAAILDTAWQRLADA